MKGERMKKYFLVLSFVFVFMFMLSGAAYAMTPEEFINTYPNQYIYRVDFPRESERYGTVIYISSSSELEFGLSDKDLYGVTLAVGKAFEIYKTGSGYWMLTKGKVEWRGDARVVVLVDAPGLIGFEGDIDIYRWTGSGFFLPVPSTFLNLKDLHGVIQTILPIGFGIMSGVLLVKLLTGYFRSYLNRLL